MNIFHWKTVFILAFPLICHICKSAVKSVFSAAVKLVIGDCRHNKCAASWHIVWGPESNQTVQLLLALIDAKFNSIRLSRRRGNGFIFLHHCSSIYHLIPQNRFVVRKLKATLAVHGWIRVWWKLTLAGSWLGRSRNVFVPCPSNSRGISVFGVYLNLQKLYFPFPTISEDRKERRRCLAFTLL